MFPTSLATTAQSFEPTPALPSLPFQHSAVATMNLMPPASYSAAVGTGGAMQNTVFAPTGLQQQPTQQPVVFSGNAGNFFFAQSPTIGSTPVILAPGQAPTPGTFVVAQSVPTAGPNNTSATLPPPANCIIRLPDGRLVVPAQAPSSVGLPSPHLSGNHPAYFPVSMTTTGPSAQQQLGLLAPNPNQTFYIQVPSTLSGFGGTMIGTSCAIASGTFPPHSTTASFQKPTQSGTSVGPNRQPILVPSSLPTLPNQGITSPKISVPTSIAFSPSINRLPTDPQKCGSIPTGSTITVGQLPNGAYTTVPFNTQPPTVSTVSSETSCKPSGPTPPTNSRRTARSRQDASGNSAVTVLHRLDEQIRILRSMSTLSDAQTARLKQLVDVREQLSKASNTNSATDTPSNSQHVPPNSEPVDVSLSVRRELLDLLAKNNLLPRVTAPPASDSVIIEFRLNTQRYSLRLTKQQKVDIERLLFSVNSQRQAEILTVLQQEQTRAYGSRARLLTPSTVPSASSSVSVSSSTATATGMTLNMPAQPLRLPAQVHAFPSMSSLPVHPATFGGPSGLRLVAARQVVPAAQGVGNSLVRGATVTLASNSPVMGLVTTLTIPPMTGQAPSTQTFVMQQPVIVSSSHMDSTVRPTSGGSSFLSQRPDSTNPSQSQTLPAQPNCEPNSLTSSQASRMNRLRSSLMHDLKCAVDRPPLVDLTSSEDPHITLLELLAPYHVQQDGDNTEEALRKADRILDNACALNLERKGTIIGAVNALLCRDSMHQMTNQLEDRLLLNRMALDLERDVFMAERKEFRDCMQALDGEDVTEASAVESKLLSSAESEDILASNPTLEVLQKRLEHRRFSSTEPVYLRHTNPSLPGPWLSLLGPLGYLRPLDFSLVSDSGAAQYATIDLPSLTGEIKPAPADSHGKSNKPNSPSFPYQPPEGNSLPTNVEAPQSMPTEDINHEDNTVDEAEADALLGLDVRHSKDPVADRLVKSNGLAVSRDTPVDDAAGFDETYDLWQELMREEGMDIEGIESDSGLDGTSSSLLPDHASKKSGLLENGSTDSIQHSEDPDLDAAIRSILTSSN